MSDAAVISVEQVSKAYRIWETPGSRLVAPLATAASRVVPGAAGQWLEANARARYRDFWALRDVNLEVRRGESVGIIGRNGSGKSTLLQIIAGTLRATSGRIDVRGRVAALLELGSGFNPEFTGRENIYLNGSILGFTSQEMDERFDAIASFADIGDFIDQPVKVYSSGMMVRLAFAVQTAVEPDVLIVDEALGVGDFFFQQKCAARMRALRERGTSLLFVSHDLSSVRDLCQQALYLRQGRTEYWGDAQEAISRYYSEPSLPAGATSTTPAAAPAAAAVDAVEAFRATALWWNENPGTAGSMDPVDLIGVAFLDAQGAPLTKAPIGSRLTVAAVFRARVEGEYHVALELKNRYDQVLTSVGSYLCGLPPLAMKAGQVARFDLTLHLNFEAGRYTCQVVMGAPGTQPNRGQRLSSSPWLGPIEISWDYENQRAPFLGMFGPPLQARFTPSLSATSNRADH